MAGKRRSTCNHCKAKKVKCSGPLVEEGKCKQCTRNGVECLFGMKQKTGPKPKAWDDVKTASTPATPPSTPPEVLVSPAMPPAAVSPAMLPTAVSPAMVPAAMSPAMLPAAGAPSNAAFRSRRSGGGTLVGEACSFGRYSVRGGKGVFRRELAREAGADDEQEGEKEVKYEVRPPPPSLISLPPRGYSTTGGSFYLPRPEADSEGAPASPLVVEEGTGGGEEVVSLWSASEDGIGADGGGGGRARMDAPINSGGAPASPRFPAESGGGNPVGRVARGGGGSGGGSGGSGAGGSGIPTGGPPFFGGGSNARAGQVWPAPFKRKNVEVDQAEQLTKRHKYGAGPAAAYLSGIPRLSYNDGFATGGGGGSRRSHAETAVTAGGGRAFPGPYNVVSGRGAGNLAPVVSEGAGACGKSSGASPAVASKEKRRHQEGAGGEQEEEERPAKKRKGQQGQPAFLPRLESNVDTCSRPPSSSPSLEAADRGGGARSGNGDFGGREEDGGQTGESEAFAGCDNGGIIATNDESNSIGGGEGGGGRCGGGGGGGGGGGPMLQSRYTSHAESCIPVGRLVAEPARRKTVNI